MVPRGVSGHPGLPPPPPPPLYPPLHSVQKLIGIAEIMPYIYTFLCYLRQCIHLLVNISTIKGVCYSRAVLQLCVGVLLDRPGLECTLNHELNSSFRVFVHSSRHLYFVAFSASTFGVFHWLDLYSRKSTDQLFLFINFGQLFCAK